MVKASLSSDPAGSAAQIAPLQLQSPIGQFLSQILTTHPHLLPAAVDQQLQQLQTQRHAEEQTQEPPASPTHDIVLYRLVPHPLEAKYIQVEDGSENSKVVTIIWHQFLFVKANCLIRRAPKADQACFFRYNSAHVA